MTSSLKVRVYGYSEVTASPCPFRDCSIVETYTYRASSDCVVFLAYVSVAPKAGFERDSCCCVKANRAVDHANITSLDYCSIKSVSTLDTKSKTSLEYWSVKLLCLR